MGMTKLEREILDAAREQTGRKLTGKDFLGWFGDLASAEDATQPGEVRVRIETMGVWVVLTAAKA